MLRILIAEDEPDTANTLAVLVAVTGYGQVSDRQRSQEAGFDHHLVKPVDTQGLEAILVTLTEEP